ncbi:MAG: type II toxin-antitoxin system VapC family toxin [Bacteroidota bacterium]
MNGSNFLVDTNFLIYLLNGRAVVTLYLNSNFFISEITEMEMLGVKGLTAEILKIRTGLIENCYIVTFNSDIKEIAIRLKQQTTLKLPDAIVAASSLYMSLPLVTADKSFLKIPGLDLHLLKL